MKILLSTLTFLVMNAYSIGGVVPDPFLNTCSEKTQKSLVEVKDLLKKSIHNNRSDCTSALLGNKNFNIRGQALEALKDFSKSEKVKVLTIALGDDSIWQRPEKIGENKAAFEITLEVYLSTLNTLGIIASRSDLESPRGRLRLIEVLKSKTGEQ